MLNPNLDSPDDLVQFKFLGILLGVAMRTKKPLDLYLAPFVWKQLAAMSVSALDLEEVDLLFVQNMRGISTIEESGVTEETFNEVHTAANQRKCDVTLSCARDLLLQVIPLDCFEAQSSDGSFVPVIPGGRSVPLTFSNRQEYATRALEYRLHEFDRQVAAVREGMSWIVPVPLLSLLSALNIERLVCGMPEVPVSVLRKVVRFAKGAHGLIDVFQTN